MTTTIRRSAFGALSTVLLTANLSAARAPATATSADEREPTYPGALTTIPWDRVGQGWTVFTYSHPDSPVGGRYHLASPQGVVYATPAVGSGLMDVSDSGLRVPAQTFEEVNDGKYVVDAHLRDLRTGKLSASVGGDEDAVLGDAHFIGSSSTHYSGVFSGQDGVTSAFARKTTPVWLFDSRDHGQRLSRDEVLPTNDGRSSVLGVQGRLKRLNNTSGATELTWRVPSPFYDYCSPTRWWSQNSMVASCSSDSGKHSVYLQGPTGASERLTTYTGRQGGGITDAWYRKGGWMIVDSPKDRVNGTTVLRHTTKAGFPAVTTGYDRSDTTPLTVIGDHYYASVEMGDSAEDGLRIIRNNLVSGSTQVLAESGPSGAITDAHTINVRD